MLTSPLGKNAFLELVAGEFLAASPPWKLIRHDKRGYDLSVGRAVAGACFVWLSFSCRPDRYWFGHAVGWDPSEAAYLHRRESRENAPLYPRDGSLRRLRTLERPRDFDNVQMSVPTFSLHRPYQDYDLETMPVETVKDLMLQEIDDLALTYLCMMLRARHGIEVTCGQLGRSLEL